MILYDWFSLSDIIMSRYLAAFSSSRPWLLTSLVVGGF